MARGYTGILTVVCLACAALCVAPGGASAASCPNEASRTGLSAALPECRAYELLTPPTNGPTPTGTSGRESAASSPFNSWLVSPAGESVVFNIEGSIPGFEGNGSQDRYRSVRSPSGWTTSSYGPNGTQSQVPHVGGNSPDGSYAFWETGSLSSNGGTLVTANEGTYLRKPDGSFEPIGLGSLGADPNAVGRWITDNGEHVIFTSDRQLEPNAASEVGLGEGRRFMNYLELEPVAAVYDRRVGGETDVASLLPGGTTPPPGSTTYYQGASADGDAIFFTINDTLYERREGRTSPMITGGGPLGALYVGSSENGARAFYMSIGEPKPPLGSSGALKGDIYEFNAETGTSNQITTNEDSYLLNISADGTHVFFSSPEQLDGTKGVAGQPNLYGWDGTTTKFIGTLATSDFETPSGAFPSNLGLWSVVATSSSFNTVGRVADPSRSTPDGSVFVFQSTAALTSFPTSGEKEIYRYEEGNPELDCVSCGAILAPQASGAELVQWSEPESSEPPTGQQTIVENLSVDGKTVFFVTKESLVPADVNHASDVYEWHDGVISLISAGTGETPTYIYGVTLSGSDVFFITYATLNWEDTDNGGPSIYDARVDGGFTEPAEVVACEPTSGGCQGAGTAAQGQGTPSSAGFQGPGNPATKVKDRKPKKHHHRKHHRKKHKKHHHKKKHRHKAHHKNHSHGKAGSKGSSR